MKLIFIILAAIATFASCAEILNEDNKRSFAEYYRSFIDLRKEFPDNLEVDVIFLDLNLDGTLDALAVSRGGKYEDGWDWCAFSRDKTGAWKPIGGVDETTGQPVEVAQIFARPDEFYRGKTENKPSHVLVLNKVYAKDMEPGVSASQVTFNHKGLLILKEVSVPDEKGLSNYEHVKSETIKE